MIKIREVISYKHYFKEFLIEQPIKVQDKIFKIIEIIEYHQQIPEKYLKHISGKKGLYEARIGLGSDIWRVFCFFDKSSLVILLNGYQKKKQKAPLAEIDKAARLMKEYFEEKNIKRNEK
jgi:phage-related protein